MKLNRFKRLIVGAVLGFMVLFSAGMITGTTAQAQDRDHRFDRHEHRDSDRGRDWNRDRGRDSSRDRDWRRDHGRVFVYPAPRVYTYPRSYPNYSPYGGGYGYGRGYGYGGGGYGYGGGSASYEEQKGYRDGLDRGQEDARSGRSPNPNNSSHYRSGNSLYRDGFRRGYSVGYRQFGGYRGW
jgi:Ni/Co efflux regulator RcnB